MTFGERFKELRLEKGLTQQGLAEDFNKIYGHTFSKPSISQYENGKRTISADLLKNICIFLSFIFLVWRYHLPLPFST